MINKDILDALADALLGTGSAKTTREIRKWYVCVPDGKGGTKKQEAASLFQAEITINDYLAAGWAAWLQDEDGNPLVIAAPSKDLN